MSCYISSANNRIYVGPEVQYGEVAPQRFRIPAFRLRARQERDRPRRRDKLGTRTYQGVQPGLPATTNYSLSTYLTRWAPESPVPVYSPLFEAVCGQAAMTLIGGHQAEAQGRILTFGSAHGLTLGQAVRIGGDLRFVTAVPSSQSVEINAPCSPGTPGTALLGRTATYFPGIDLASVSIFDHWSPVSAVQRILSGAAVDEFRVSVNGDFHSFEFSGEAADILDSESFQAAQGGLSGFPEEPVTAPAAFSLVPGNLGQVWLGTAPDRFFTLTQAAFAFTNNIELRKGEFGIAAPRCITAGERSVRASFTLLAQDSQQTRELYKVARSESPVPIMIQVGETPGSLFGIHLRSAVFDTPEFDDSRTSLAWTFRNVRAQGTVEDEVFLAFG